MVMTPATTFLLFPLLGYLFGSLPFSIWITRFAKGVDVRDSGSGHATTTNTIRQAGFGWGALVLLLDIAKGFIPVWLAVGRDNIPPYIIPLTAAMVIVGHCWPVFAQFRGGMGLASAGGAFLAVNPLTFLICLGILILLLLGIHHAARATVFTGIVVAPVLWMFGIRDDSFWIAVAMGIVIALRFLIDWNRQYRELWLDRENPG